MKHGAPERYEGKKKLSAAAAVLAAGLSAASAEAGEVKGGEIHTGEPTTTERVETEPKSKYNELMKELIQIGGDTEGWNKSPKKMMERSKEIRDQLRQLEQEKGRSEANEPAGNTETRSTTEDSSERSDPNANNVVEEVVGSMKESADKIGDRAGSVGDLMKRLDALERKWKPRK